MQLLDCTLRDGSYVIHFQFSAAHTRLISRALDVAGVPYIEVGHGIGLGASEKGLGTAKETDETYLKVTAESVERAKWGMFCIPGIAELSHIDLAAEYKMPLIRIGTKLEAFASIKPFIEKAKAHGMQVCCNFMKSYVCPPEQFADYANQASEFGADVIYIVDSAGGMLPNEVMQYADAVKQKNAAIKLGFHGHNNLGLGVANSLAAYQAGVDIVDTSLQGFGRGGGNTPTEQLLCALLRQGETSGLDPIELMSIGEEHILPLISNKGLDSIDLTCGLALFHSSYLNTIHDKATTHGLDPRALILAVSQRDKMNAPDELVEQCARMLTQEATAKAKKVFSKVYVGGEQ